MYAPSVREGGNNSRQPVLFKASTRYLSCFLSRKPCYQEMLLDGRFFSLLVGSVLMVEPEIRFHGEIHNFWDVSFFSPPNRSQYSQHYHADSDLFCKVGFSPAEARLGRYLCCIGWGSPSEGSPRIAFSDVGRWWQGKVASKDLRCLNGKDYRGLPEDFR